MEQLRQLASDSRKDLLTGLLSLLVGVCGCSVILCSFAKATFQLGRELRTFTGTVCARRTSTVGMDYSDPAFVTSLGQTVTSALQTIMIGPNSQLRTEFMNSQHDNMDRLHAGTQSQLQEMRRQSSYQHKQILEKLNVLSDQARLAHPSKHLRECQGIRSSLTEFRDAMPPEFRNVHDLLLDFKQATTLADQTAEQQLEAIRDITTGLKTSAFESKVANSCTDMLEHHRGFNSKFAQYHDGQLAFQDGLKKSVNAMGQNTSNATIQDIVKGCLQNDARLHSMNTHARRD